MVNRIVEGPQGVIHLFDQGQGIPLLLVHGFPLDHTMWLPQQPLSDCCRLLAPDLRGFGRSSPADGEMTMRQMSDDLAGLLDALSLDQPIVIGGLSMGGYVALQFWQTYRERLAGLILCDTRAAADTPEVAAGREAAAQAQCAKEYRPWPTKCCRACSLAARFPKLRNSSSRRGK